MTAHRYAMAELGGDYARGAAGLALTALPLILLPMHWIVALAFAVAALVFLAFLLRTWLRHRSVIEADDQGIVAHGPFGVRIAWRDLSHFRLRYFSVRRDRQRGWMQLDLGGGGGRRLKIESTISGFEEIASRAHDAAVAKGLPIDDSSQANLMSLGLIAPKGGLAERWGVRPAGDGSEE
ncbi:hypothetical protein [Inquilinus limosus]|uniref:hypothetical protein n=1 Tax=Inquilinus limosus TaxID=171674 RepID=UPI0004284F1A|nr:hypothetical protein [Inquilinus limosus]